MQINDDNIVINNQSVSWGDIKNIRLTNDKLLLVLSNDNVLEASNLNPSIVDTAFRAYEAYLKAHPER